MATDAFVQGDLVLVDFPGSGYWPCQVSRIMSKHWRKVEYFGGGGEIGKAHVQVIRDYDEATKDDLEEYIPKKKMDKDPVLRQAVKEINQKLTGKKVKISGVGITIRREAKKMSDKKETGGKQKSQKISENKEVTAATNETRKTGGTKEIIGTNNETKKNKRKVELEKRKIAEKKAFIGTRNKTKKITGITTIISTTKENDRKKERPRTLSDMRGTDRLINTDSPEYEQSRPNNEVQLANNNTDTSENINSHLLPNGGSSSTNSNIESSRPRLGRSCGNNNLKVPLSGAFDNVNSDSCGVSVSTSISQGTSVNNNHGVAEDVDITIKCELFEDTNNNSDTSGTEDPSPPTTAEDAVVQGSSASSGNGAAFSTEDIYAEEATAAGSSTSSENSGAFSAQDNSGASSREGISANNLGDPQHNTEDTVRLNISMEMTPNTFSQISPALLTFVSQPNVTVHINVPH